MGSMIGPHAGVCVAKESRSRLKLLNIAFRRAVAAGSIRGCASAEGVSCPFCNSRVACTDLPSFSPAPLCVFPVHILNHKAR